MGQVKDEVIEMIRRLPDDVTIDDVMEALYLKQKVDRGMADFEAGRVLTEDEIRERIARWRKLAGR